MPVRFLPDQPHKYFNREVTIVGYPGEKNRKEMYAHSGPIKKVDPQGTVYYEVDTSGGNSGSPVFLELNGKRDKKSVVVENFPVSVVHTHNVNDELNAGEKIDEDLVDFMEELLIISNKK